MLLCACVWDYGLEFNLVLGFETLPPGSVVVWRGGGLGSRPKKCTGRDWGMGSSTI